MSSTERIRQRRARAALVSMLGLAALVCAQLGGGDLGDERVAGDRHVQLATACDSPLAPAGHHDERGRDAAADGAHASAIAARAAACPRAHDRYGIAPRSRARLALIVAPKTSPPLRR